MSREARALRWIVGLLEELEVPFQVVGGLAAGAYGATRPLVDLDFYVPTRCLPIVAGAADSRLVRAPEHHRDENWDITFMALEHEGQRIELGGADGAGWLRTATLRHIFCISDIQRFCPVRLSMTERSTKVGKRGTVVIPAITRRRYGIEEGSLLIVAERAEGILLQPAELVPAEIYSPERIAEFLLSNAVSASDYEAARDEVRRMGLEPDDIEHVRPPEDSA
jgi:AbrB family looped-hinge helix DNA binding protein